VEGGCHDRFASTVTVTFRGGGKPQKYGFRVDGRFAEFQVYNLLNAKRVIKLLKDDIWLINN
jgi:hypothetical protein